MIRRLLVLAVATALTLTACGGSDTAPAEGKTTVVKVVAASSLTEAFTKLETAYEKAHPGTDIQLSFDSSAILVEQLTQGMKADVLATADEKTMTRARQAGLLKGQAESFATNTLTIVTPAGNPAKVAGLDSLGTYAACVAAAPCGAATKELLKLNSIDAKPTTEEQNVKGVLTKVTLGEVDAGLVYVSDARAAGDKVEIVKAANASEVVNVDPIASLKTTTDAKAAKAWIDLVLGPAGQKVFADLGFGPRG